MFEKLLRFNTQKTIILFDLETFNLTLNFCNNLPWQVTMLKIVGNEIKEEKDYMVKWDTKLKISEGAAIVTKYSQSKMDKLGVAPESVYPTLKEWFDSADYIMGHNILGFDINLIYHWYRLNGDNPNHLIQKTIDTNTLAKGIKMKIPYKTGENFLEYQYKLYHKKAKGIKTNLTALGKEYGIDYDYDNLHNSLLDCRLNKIIWDKLKFQIEI